MSLLHYCKRFNCKTQSKWHEDKKLHGYYEGFIGYKEMPFGRVALIAVEHFCTGSQESNFEYEEKQITFFHGDIDNIPQSARDHENEYIHSMFKSMDYNLVDEGVFDTDKKVFIPDDQFKDCDTRTIINWLLEPKKGDNNIKLHLSLLLLNVFGDCAHKLGFKSNKPDSVMKQGDIVLPDTLFETSSFKLTVNSGFSDNSIHPKNLVGSGGINAYHGYQPLLLLCLLSKRIHETFPGHQEGKQWLSMADDEGELFQFKRFSSLKPIIEKFGFDEDKVRSDAELIGLVEPIIRLDQIETDIEDCFF